MSDNAYWLFSAAAQSISAFVAFLLTGYALVCSIMDTRERGDMSLAEIHEELKRKYHRYLVLLSACTAGAVASSLVCVYLVPVAFPWKSYLYGATALLDLAAMLGGVLFVVSIVNPDKYRRVARKMLEDVGRGGKLEGAPVSVGDFLTAFIALERSLRSFIADRQISLMDPRKPGLSFSDILYTLRADEAADSGLLAELTEISKYRNLVVHGHVDQVSAAMFDRLKAAAAQWERTTGTLAGHRGPASPSQPRLRS